MGVALFELFVVTPILFLKIPGPRKLIVSLVMVISSMALFGFGLAIKLGFVNL